VVGCHHDHCYFGCYVVTHQPRFAARHAVVRVFTEDESIRAATVLVVPAVATSVVGESWVVIVVNVLLAVMLLHISPA
jgi:hypothetical protein